jgi:hypothetical protein
MERGRKLFFGTARVNFSGTAKAWAAVRTETQGCKLNRPMI